MSRVAVIILNWNGEKLLQQFLPSVIKYTNSDLARIIVADNNSTDNSLQILQQFPQVEVIRFDENYGYAGGYNQAIEQVNDEIIILLNSDVAVTKRWIEPLIEILDDDPDIVALQPKIKAYNNPEYFEYAGACGGYIDKWGFPFCRGRILNTTEEDRGQYNTTVEIFWASGAALCIRRQAYVQQGGLDEKFFAHMEEIDLCWRLRNAGYSIKVVPQSVVHHLGGGSLPINHPRKVFLNYRNNFLMLYKNLPKGQRRKVMFVRFFLDNLAADVFLLKFQFSNFWAIYKAYFSYFKLRKSYKPIEKKHTDMCIYKKSIIYAYYIKKQRKYSQLNWKN